MGVVIMNEHQHVKKVVICVKNHEINANRSRVLKKKIISHIDNDYKVIELDFSDVYKIDSLGIAQLLIGYRKVSEAAGKLRIINVNNEYIKTIIKLIHLDNIMEVKFN